MTPRKPSGPAGAGTTGAAGGARANSGKVSVLPREDAEPAGATVLEFPEPPARRRRRVLLLTLLGLVLVVGGLLAYLIFSPVLALKHLRVEGNTLVSTEEVTAALEPLKGTSLTRLPDEKVEGLLRDKAPIEAVRVAAEPPSTLVVTIRERVPVAIVQKDKQFILIDSEGRQLKTVADRKAVKLPLIDGGTEAVNSEVFRSITAVLADLPPDILSRLNHASARSVDSVSLSLTGNQKIFWGSAERNTAKAKVLAALLKVPASDPPVKEFDVSTPDRPVTR
jgi:cell division protein FtsQ